MGLSGRAKDKDAGGSPLRRDDHFFNKERKMGDSFRRRPSVLHGVS
jgi:hypothetical protein